MSSNNLKFVLKTIGLFLIISFLTDKLVYVVFNKLSDKVLSGQGIGKLNQYLKNKDDYDLIIFGSSRANHNIDPSSIEKLGFNMGVDGKKIAYASTLIKLLPKEKKQLILLHIDPTNFLSNEYIGKDIKDLLPKYNRNETIKTEIDKLNLQNTFQKFYWSLSYNGKAFSILKNYFKPKYDYTNYNGFDPIKVSANQRTIFENILKQNKSINCLDSFNTNKIYTRLLSEIKYFCSKNNKTLVLFTSPAFDDKCKNDNIELNNYMKKNGFIYTDFTDFYGADSSLNNWKDGSHLSSIGAKIFTDSVRQFLAGIQ